MKFAQEFEHLYRCSCSNLHLGEEIINAGWISKISQFRSTTDDSNFCNEITDHVSLISNYSIILFSDRKRRRVDPEDSMNVIRFVRFCSVCRPPPIKTKINEKKREEQIESSTKVFIDPLQATDLLSCYM